MIRRLLVTLSVTCLLGAFVALALAWASAAAAEKPVLRFYSYFNDEPAVRAFEQKYDIKVEYSFIGWGELREKTPVMVASQTLPDVIRVSGHWWNTVEADEYMDLMPYVQRDRMELSRFVPHELKATYHEGQLLGIPFAGWGAIPTGILVYNADQYEESGLAVPDWNWTWTDFITQARRLTIDLNGDGFPDRWGTGYSRMWENAFVHAMHSFGVRFFSADGRKSTVNSPQAVQALQFLKDMGDVHEVLPPPGVSASFDKGQVASVAQWTHHAAALITKVDALGIRAVAYPFPKGPAGRQLTRPMGYPFDPLVISKTTKYPEAAWQLVKFVSIDAEGTRSLIAAGVDPLPLVPYRANLPAFLDALPPILKQNWFPAMERIVNETLAEKDAEIFPAAWLEFERKGTRAQLGNAFLSGQTSPAEVLDAWQRELDSLLQ